MDKYGENMDVKNLCASYFCPKPFIFYYSLRSLACHIRWNESPKSLLKMKLRKFQCMSRKPPMVPLNGFEGISIYMLQDETEIQ